jgi:chromosomal replication initiation ATPase DnaA
MIAKTVNNPAAAEHMRVVEAELRRLNPRPVYRTATRAEVLEQVCEVMGVEVSEALVFDRRRWRTSIRRVAAVCMRDICRSSWPEIAMQLQYRSHTGPLHQYGIELSHEERAAVNEVKHRFTVRVRGAAL